jgi:hypothetical protein
MNQLSRQVKIFEIVTQMPNPDDQAVDSHVAQRIRPALDPEEDLLTLLGKLRPEASEDDDDEDGTGAFLRGRHGFMMHSRVHRSSGRNAAHVFVLARVRAGEGGFPIVNRETGEYREFMLADNEGFAEESHIAFFPNNIVAVVSNGQGAPGPVRIEEYLQKRLDWQDSTIKVVALTPPERLESLRRNNNYTRAARVRLPASSHELLPKGDNFYSDVTRMAHRRFGDGVAVDMTVKVPTHGAQGAADALFEDFMQVSDSGEAQSLEVTFEDRETSKGRAINLLNDVLAYTAPVTVERQDGDGAARVFSEWSTSRALMGAYHALREEIEAATADS